MFLENVTFCQLSNPGENLRIRLDLHSRNSIITSSPFPAKFLHGSDPWCRDSSSFQRSIDHANTRKIHIGIT